MFRWRANGALSGMKTERHDIAYEFWGCDSSTKEKSSSTNVVVVVVLVLVARAAQNMLEERLTNPVTHFNSPPDEPRHACTEEKT